MPRATTALRRRLPSLRHHRRHRHQAQIPLALIGGFVPLGIRGYNGFKANGIVGGVGGISSGLIGYNVFSKKFEWAAMAEGLLPILAGAAVHKFANVVGINRFLAKARVPLLRI